jgi:hypothetical protein
MSSFVLECKILKQIVNQGEKEIQLIFETEQIFNFWKLSSHIEICQFLPN